MKPIMMAFAVLAFAVLPSEVWAQAEGESDYDRERRERAERAAEQYRARQEGGEAAAEAVRERQTEAEARQAEAEAEARQVEAEQRRERAAERNERAAERNVERARERAERAIADYKVIEREAVLAERAAREAQRDLTEAEGEDDDDYMKAWDRAQSASARALAVLEIAQKAEYWAKQAQSAAEDSAGYYAEAEGRKSRGAGRVDYFYTAAGGAARRAGENASEVANLRAQVEG